MKKLLFGMLAVTALATTSCKDKCKDVDCNAGVCEDGICNCNEGYTGDDCSQYVTPTKVTITQIDINDFPGTDGGSDWDPVIDTDPDIIVEVYDDANSNTIYSSSSFDNTPDGTTFSINGLAIALTNVTGTYTMMMWDDDLTSGNDSMGDISFTPYEGAGFPSTMVVENQALGLSYTLHLSYQW